MKNKLLFCLFFVCIQTPSFHAQQHVIDSITKLLKTLKKDTSIVNETTKLGVAYKNAGDFKKSLELLHQSEKLANKINFKKGYAVSLTNQGVIYGIQGDFETCASVFEKALRVFKEIKYKQGISSCLNNLGILYKKQGNYIKAIDKYYEALKIDEALGNKTGMASIYNNISNIYNTQNKSKEALEMAFKALYIRLELNEISRISTAYNNVANIYYDLKNYDKAFYYYNKALNAAKKSNDKIAMSTALSNLGVYYLDVKNDPAKSLKLFQETIEIRQQNNDLEGIVNGYANIARANIQLGKVKEAEIWIDKALAISLQYGIKDELKEVYLLKSVTDSATGNYSAALTHYKMFIIYRDSLKNVELDEKLFQSSVQHKYEKIQYTDSIKHAQKQQQISAKLQTQKNLSWIGAGVAFLLILFSLYIFKNNKLLAQKNHEVTFQKALVEQKNTEITDSISYAKRIQKAILPSDKVLNSCFKESFFLNKPKDIVSGDFIWIEKQPHQIFFAVADCTGHGVPGAMVSVICHNSLNRSVREYQLTDPGKILDKTRDIVIDEFSKSDSEVKDGMDIALCSLQEQTLKYAGANNPLWIIRNNDVLVFKATKEPVGKVDRAGNFQTHEIKLEKGDCLYLFSDGFADQFGGEKGKKFKYQQLKDTLVQIHQKSMADQRELLQQVFESWRGSLEQVDDVCILGVRV